MKDQVLSKEEKSFLKLLDFSVHHIQASDILLSYDEWKAVLKLAKIHNVLPLVFEKAAEVNGFMELFNNSKIMMQVVTGVSRQAQRTEEFLILYKKLQQEGLAPIVMKGLICRGLYGDYCNHRPSGDEDILIRKEEFELIKKIFVENDYIPEEKFAQITTEQMETVQEITFRNKQARMVIEVHINPTGYENDIRTKMNDYFVDVFERSKTVYIDGVPVETMNDTDHYLFLVFHAFRHFTVGGLGIRQVLDILLYEQEYASKIDWKYIKESLVKIGADGFFSDLHAIGNSYLGFDLPVIGKTRCPEALLEDLLCNGTFGNGTQAQRVVVQAVGDAMKKRNEKREGTAKTIFYALFPQKERMWRYYPELETKPWLLPVRFVQRWGRFFVRNKAGVGKFAVESMEISNRRIQLLKKYDIL